MTIIEALRACNGHPIRRASWIMGNRIQWDPHLMVWKFGNLFSTDMLGGDWCLGESGIIAESPFGAGRYSQGCLTPESMLANDWEVVT